MRLLSLFGSKTIFFALFVVIVAGGCKTPPELSDAGTINLALLDSRYIDLSQYNGTVLKITGDYQGDRIVFSNARNKILNFKDCTIWSNHNEDAICFTDSVHNIRITGKLHINGAITFWGLISRVDIDHVTIEGAHSGIRATQDRAHRRVTISHCSFRDIKHEAIYVGASKDTPDKAVGIDIFKNKFVNIGWDAVQVGNAHSFSIKDNVIERAGFLSVYGQNYGITVNPGSQGMLCRNTIKDTPNAIQILDSRAFFCDN